MRGRRAQYEEFDALEGRVVRDPRGLDVRPHRRERLGQEHAAQVHRPDPATRRGRDPQRRARSRRCSSSAPASTPSCRVATTSTSTARSSGCRRSSSTRASTRSSSFAGLEHFIDTPVKNYSSGMYVRLGFSVAINVDPDILLVDEVLAVGDEEFQRKCSEKFAELKRQRQDHRDRLARARLGAQPLRRGRAARARQARRRRRRRAKSSTSTSPTSTSTAIADGEHGTRWGSGEGQIDRDRAARRATVAPAATVRTGDPLTFRLHYDMTEPIDRPVFGLAIQTLEGVTVTGPNTREAGVGPGRLEGTGHVDLRVAAADARAGHLRPQRVALRLLAARTPSTSATARCASTSSAGDPHEQFGVVSLGGAWTMTARAAPAMRRRWRRSGMTDVVVGGCWSPPATC